MMSRDHDNRPSEQGSNDALLTRHTLIVRLGDSADDASWREFADIYSPLLQAYCLKRQMSHADAADVVQDTLRSVSLALCKGGYDPGKGKFRAWLFTCIRNAVSTHYSKKLRQPLTIGETAVLAAIDKEPPSAAEEKDWERDYQEQLVAWAIDKIRPEFAPRIWRAFEATALQHQKPADVCDEVGMSNNAIAVAKHRVLTRLKQKVHSIDADRWEQEMIAHDA